MFDRTEAPFYAQGVSDLSSRSGPNEQSTVLVRKDGPYLKKSQDFILGDFRPSLCSLRRDGTDLVAYPNPPLRGGLVSAVPTGLEKASLAHSSLNLTQASRSVKNRWAWP
jgi:hypothetical protein